MKAALKWLPTEGNGLVRRSAWLSLVCQVLRIGQDYTLMPGDATGQVVVVAGNATIEGRVDRDVVVVLGRARLSSSAAINGSLIVIGGGSVGIESGAKVGRDLVVVGGRLDAPAQFTTGGQQIVIGPAVSEYAIKGWIGVDDGSRRHGRVAAPSRQRAISSNKCARRVESFRSRDRL